MLDVDDRRRHQDRLRRRVDQVRRDLGAHRRRLVLRAHDGAEHAVSGRRAAVQGQRHRDAGRSRTRGSSACIAPASRSTATPTATSRSTCILTAVERAQKLFPRADARPKITHCTLINDDLVRRIKAVGAVPALFTTYAYYNTDKFVFYGEELMKRCMAYPLVARRRRSGGGRFGFQPGPVRAADGHSGHGDAHGLGRQDVGRQPADHASTRRSRSTRSTAPTRRARRRSRDRSRRASSPTSSCSRTIRTRSTPEKIKDIQIVRTVVGGSTVYQA